jgi:D-3-phosphoglycerate dehydrogenase
MSASFKVLVADRIAREGLAPLAADARFQLLEKPGLTGAALAEAMAEADAVLVRSATKITRESLARVTRLKVIGRAGVGVDTIDVEAATERGIAVMNAPAGNTISAAELAFALLASLVRRIPAADRSMKAGHWERTAFSGSELYRKTLGLIGAGRIGSEVAARARAFGMRVLAYDPYLSPETARGLGMELTDLEDVLRQADAISLHVPLTESTRGMLNAERLALLKPTAVIINAARGGLIDEAALIQRLGEGQIAGAAIDVFDHEPVPADHPLRALPNVILTPHLGASTEEAQLNVALEIAEAVKAALLEGDFSGAVNAPLVGGERLQRLRPLLDLATRLGRLGAALLDGPVRTIEVRVAGEGQDLVRPIAAGAVIGVLERAVGSAGVNVVNALHLARQRGIGVEQTRVEAGHPGSESIEVRLGGSGDAVRVAGAMLAEGHPRIVGINSFRINVAPRGILLILQNRDVPGVIGRVGTLLGDAGINIAEYHQARLGAGGEALAAVSVDAALPGWQLAALQSMPDIHKVALAGMDGPPG